MRSILLGTTAFLAFGLAAASADPLEGQEFEAVLAGQAVLPARTLVAAPADAPSFLRQVGKFTTPDRKRATELGAVPAMDGVRPTGFGLPLDGQAVQGFSGIRHMPDGTYWSLSDNGLGTKANSYDAALMLHHIALDFDKGTLDRHETVFLSDPDRKAPFPIVLEGSEQRYLTGADFDVESIQPVSDGFWLGDEFGPYLLKVDRAGRLQSVHDTRVGDVPVLSPDNPTLALPANPAKPMPAFNLKRSGGYEGLARSPDGTRLYGLIEGPLYKGGEVEKTDDGRTALRIVEFDVAKGDWTGRSWLYPLGAGGEAIGDFNMLEDGTALVIERDNGEGRTSQACTGAPRPDCFTTPAKVKRVYRIAFGDDDVGKAVRKIGYIDLLAIKDPKALARQGGEEGVYDMPFVTIENVDRVDATHIVVGNDNNFPYSAGRSLDNADDNEFVLLDVSDFLTAK